MTLSRKFLFALLLSLAAMVAVSGVAFAQDDEEEEEDETPTLMSERAFKRLSQVHEAMGDKRYDEALSKLKSMESMRLSDYERALVLQAYGFVWAQQDQYSKAIPYFEQCLALGALPKKAQQGMLYSMAGIYASQQQFEKAIETLLIWLPNEKDPPADAFIMIASAYAELKRYDEALPWVRKAIAKADKPKESWYQLELAVHFEQRNYNEAVKTLNKMVGFWPDKLTYWEMLSGAHQQAGNDVEAMASLWLAYKNGLVTEERKLLNIARMRLFVETPYEAGKFLEAEIARGRVQANQKNLELLLSAWTQAREFEKAIAVIDRIAPMTSDGQYSLRKAQLYAERNDWENVVESAKQAIEKGGLRKPGAAYVLKGMAEAELGRYQSALSSLGQAKNYDNNSRQQAEGWIAYVRDKMAIRS